ncbi:RhoGAP domain-containing protein [Providencia zhijiangensis]|uniref:RhoGAP domain-containing protein n=1 Tax=Providencia zhijiangensis TaxID=3053982 RepID=A0ABZ0N518_9GAMM|nr:RhoGAP domain-containing protein [Providencia sp. D4759]WPA93489.1 RhoGAP domain-containing protein [Providencia sp. D4759]
MALNTVNHPPKPQLSAHNAKETNQTENKASSHFKTSLRKVTQSFTSFFSLLFSCQSKHVSKKKTVSDEAFVMISLPNKGASSRTVSFADETSAKNLSPQDGIIPKAGLTGNPRVDAARAAALNAVAQHKAQRAEKTRKNETDKLQQSNELLINNYDRLSDIDREKNHAINLLGCKILKHNEYATSEGILRTEGSKNAVSELVNMINDPNGHLTLAVNCSLQTLTSAFKKIAGELLRKTNNIDFKSDISFDDLQACADAVKNKEDVAQQIKNIEQLKNKAPSILKNCDKRIHSALSRLAPPPLTLQLVTRFCALISNDEASHKMSIRNLAMIFAPHLINTSSTPQHNSQDSLAELRKEAEVTKLAENYIAALIHQEKSLFHRL